MSTGYSNIYMNIGETFKSQLTLTDSTGASYNLSGFSVASSARRSYYSTNTAIDFIVTITDSSNGVIQLSANSDTTKNVYTYGGTNLVYDVLIKDSSNNVSRVLEGIVYLSPGVTSFS